jgi:hypothetical protein
MKILNSAVTKQTIYECSVFKHIHVYGKKVYFCVIDMAHRLSIELHNTKRASQTRG